MKAEGSSQALRSNDNRRDHARRKGKVVRTSRRPHISADQRTDMPIVTNVGELGCTFAGKQRSLVFTAKLRQKDETPEQGK